MYRTIKINKLMKINKDSIRIWLRKFYKCHWTFNKDTISINCDGEEFYISISNLDKEDLKELKNIINYEKFKENSPTI